MNEIFRMFFHRTNKYMYSEKTFAVIEKNNVYLLYSDDKSVFYMSVQPKHMDNIQSLYITDNINVYNLINKKFKCFYDDKKINAEYKKIKIILYTLFGI